MSVSRAPKITQIGTCVLASFRPANRPARVDVSSSSEWAAKTPSTHWDTASSTHWDKASTEWAKTPSTHWDTAASTHWDKASTVSTHWDSTEWAALLNR